MPRSGKTPDSKVVEWLVGTDQPSVRYHALKSLLDRKESDPEVRASRSQIAERRWARTIRRRQRPEG